MQDILRELPAEGEYAFMRAQIERVGERDPLAILAETGSWLLTLTRQRSQAELGIRPVTGGWTAAEVIAHMADVEWIFGFRTRTILCDETPEFPGVDQDRWVSIPRQNERPGAEWARDFATLRELNLRLWRSLGPEELARAGRHTGAGLTLSLDFLRHLLAGHDLAHREQIEKILGDG